MRQLPIKKQNGAVLAFCLVMLLLLTLAGTRMIQKNKQQLEMANSARLLTQEFANAEGVLADTQSIINGSTPLEGTTFALAHNNFYTPDDGYFPIDTKIKIDDPRKEWRDRHQCRPTAKLNQNIGLPGTINSSATILSVSCRSNKTSVNHTCIEYFPNVIPANRFRYTCYLGRGVVSDTTVGVDCTEVVNDIKNGRKDMDAMTTIFLPDSSLDASGNVCYQPYDPNPDDDNPDPTKRSCTINPNNPGCFEPKLPENDPRLIPKCPKEVYKIYVRSTDTNNTTREIVSDFVVACGS